MKHLATALVFLLLTVQISGAETFNIWFENGRVKRHYPAGLYPVIGLALSGGGARGIAHIGVIEVLEENGINIERIAGTSMGSIVGGLYAAGYRTRTLATMLETVDWSNTFSDTPKRRSIYVPEKETSNWPLFDLRFDGYHAQIPSSLSSGQEILNQLSWLLLRPSFECGEDFDKLPIPFRSMTTDLTTGDMVVLRRGNLARAIQASATIPLIFTPVEWEGKLLVDGGLKNNLPVNVIRDMGGDFIIAVTIEESMHLPEHLENPLNVADQVTSILMRNLTNLYKGEADFVINPELEAFSSRDFTEIPAMIERGRIATRAVLPELMHALAEKRSTYEKISLQTITVSPAPESLLVTDILLRYLHPGADGTTADIVTGLEELWNTGRYLKIGAELKREDGCLHLQVQRVPSAITLVERNAGYGNQSGNASDTTFSLSPHVHFTAAIDQVDSVLHSIRSRGPAFAGINDMQYDEGADSLTLYVSTPRITKISFDSNLKTRRSVIMREFNVGVGEVFDLRKLMNTIDNLYGTNQFELVYADVMPFKGGVGLDLHITERDWSVMRMGLRFDETNQTEGRVSFSRENILGFGNQFSVFGHAGKRKKLILLQNKIDRIYKTFYTFDFKTYRHYRRRPLYEEHKNIIDFDDDRYGTIIALGQQMDKLGNAVFQFKTETIWTHFAPAARMKNEQKELRSLVLRFLIDSYDQYPFPKNGKLNIIYIESAHDFFGGTEKFVKFYWSGAYLKTIRKRHTLSGSFALGSADTSTPTVESFMLGGNSSRLNCYNYDTAMSHFYADFQGLHSEERNGNYLAVGKFSYRLFVPRFFYLDLIFNIGNVWNNSEAITFESLLMGYGVRGSFDTYLGPLSIGWGITSEGDDRLHMLAGWEF